MPYNFQKIDLAVFILVMEMTMSISPMAALLRNKTRTYLENKMLYLAQQKNYPNVNCFAFKR